MTDLLVKLKSATDYHDRLMDGADDNPACFPQADLCHKHHLPIIDGTDCCRKCESEIDAAENRADERREGNY